MLEAMHFSFQEYFNFLDKGKGKFRLSNDRKEIEDKIIEFVVSLKKEGMSHYGNCNYIVAVKFSNAIYYLTLNVKNPRKLMRGHKRVRKDKF